MSLFVVLVGFNASGKTTLAKRLEDDLGFNIVSGDPLRLMMKEHIKYFHDFDISIPTEKGRGTGDIIHSYRKQISQLLLDRGQPVIYDSNALKRTDRESIFSDVLQGGRNHTTIIIWVTLDEAELLRRLQARPEPNWLEHYEKYKKSAFQEPAADEADHLLTYNQLNYDEIVSKLQALLV